MHLFSLALLALLLVPAGAQAQRRPPRAEEPRYLLFWRGPDAAGDLVRKVGTVGDGRTRLLGFGVPCSTFELEKQVPALMHAAFAAARKYNLALMLHYDFHIAWQNRPDLWNWFDPKQPGYNPANKANVEWYGWDGPPAKARYLNWGIPQRIGPPPCLTSKRLRQEWARLVNVVIVPPLRRELAALKREGKERLFAGILVGSEPVFDDLTHPDDVTAKMMDEDGAPRARLGYRSLMDRGYSKDHPPAKLTDALGSVLQETVATWCRLFAEAGIPTSKLYPHAVAQPPDEAGTPISVAFNRWSRPGWSTYAVMRLGEGFQPLYAELRKHGSPPWGGVEANAGMPGSAVDWETYLAWHYNHGAVLVAVNTGASGKELPDRLEKSAYGPEALAAYRKFLRGGKLKEGPLTYATPEARLQHKMQLVQKAFHEWQAAGRDPSSIARPLESRLPALVQAGKLAEAEALLDDALKQLGAGGK